MAAAARRSNYRNHKEMYLGFGTDIKMTEIYFCRSSTDQTTNVKDTNDDAPLF